MGGIESDEMRFQYGNSVPGMKMDTTSLPEKVSGLAISSLDASNSSYLESLYGSGWVPVASLNQSEGLWAPSVLVSHGEFANSSPSLMGDLGMNSRAHVVRYSIDPNLGQMELKLPDFCCGNISELVSSFDQAGHGYISNAVRPPNSALDNEKVLAVEVHTHGGALITDEPASKEACSNGKRRRAPDHSSPLMGNKNAQGDTQMDVARSTLGPEQLNEKKQKIKNDACTKHTTKQCRETSQDTDPPKEECVHARAKRGHATNSHSLAERVRREKISERMRLLQELVPGCTKVTGKAVMLDEIINYVQSLQQQVEFLSMKLATVNSELNINIDRILSKDVIFSHAGATSIPLLNLGIGPSQLSEQGFVAESLLGIPNTNPHYHPMAQAVCDDLPENLIQMGVGADAAVGSGTTWEVENGGVGVQEKVQIAKDSCST